MQPFRDFMPRDREALAAMLDQVFGSRLTPAIRTRPLANDLDALRTLTQDRESSADVLPSMTMPGLLLAGELDPRLIQVRAMCARPFKRTYFQFAGMRSHRYIRLQ
jgi:hypothetical protein